MQSCSSYWRGIKKMIKLQFEICEVTHILFNKKVRRYSSIGGIVRLHILAPQSFDLYLNIFITILYIV